MEWDVTTEEGKMEKKKRKWLPWGQRLHLLFEFPMTPCFWELSLCFGRWYSLRHSLWRGLNPTSHSGKTSEVNFWHCLQRLVHGQCTVCVETVKLLHVKTFKIHRHLGNPVFGRPTFPQASPSFLNFLFVCFWGIIHMPHNSQFIQWFSLPSNRYHYLITRYFITPQKNPAPG